MIDSLNLKSFPGGDLIEKGIRDLEASQETIESLLVAIGYPKLTSLGLILPPSPFKHPEHRLYAVLLDVHGDAAYSKYNALIRSLVSFERALACAKSQITAL